MINTKSDCWKSRHTTQELHPVAQWKDKAVKKENKISTKAGISINELSSMSQACIPLPKLAACFLFLPEQP